MGKLSPLVMLVLLAGCPVRSYQKQPVLTPECARVELAEPCVMKNGQLGKKCKFKVRIDCVKYQ